MKLLIGVIIGGLVGGGVVWGYDNELNELIMQQQMFELQFQQERHNQEEFMREQRQQQRNPC